MVAPLNVPNAIVNGIPADGAKLGANFSAIESWASAASSELNAAAAAAASASADGAPLGTVAFSAALEAPAKWLWAEGQAISRTTYSALFGVIGTAFGAGDGSTTFNLPDLRGRFPVGLSGNDTLFNARGKTGGSKDAVVVSHNHTGSTANHSHSHTGGAHTHTINHTHASFSTSGNDGSHGHSLLARPNVGTGASRLAGGGAGADHTVTINEHSSSNHSHSISVPAFSGNSGSGGAVSTSSHTHNHSFTTGTTGVSGTNANLPPFMALRAMIRAVV